MKNPNSIVKEKISHLNWCLEKLKYKEAAQSGDDFEFLYRHIFNVVKEMEELEPSDASIYYNKEMYNPQIQGLLARYNIELSI